MTVAITPGQMDGLAQFVVNVFHIHLQQRGHVLPSLLSVEDVEVRVS